MSTNSTRSSGSASGIISVPAFNQMVTVKLTGENLLLWTMQLFPYLRSQKLMGYIDGTRERPLPTITEGEGGDDARSVANPVFEQWYQQDQLVLSARLSSLGDTVLATPCWRKSLGAPVLTRCGVSSSRLSPPRLAPRSCRSGCNWRRYKRRTSQLITEYFLKVKNLADTLAVP